jgi:hypothetical protein
MKTFKYFYFIFLICIISFQFFNAEAVGIDAPSHQVLWKVEHPLNESVVIPSRVPQKDRGNMIWSSPLAENRLRNLALSYGTPYSIDDILEDFGKRRVFVLRSAKAILRKQDELRLQYKRFNTRVILYAFYYDRKARKSYPFLFNKDFTESQLSLCRQALEQCGDFIWGVFTGDEHFPRVLKTLPKFKEGAFQWAKIKDIDSEVRSQYGFGKFGIPTGMKDPNPFRWSAFYRWLVDKMIDRQKQLYLLTKKLAPDVKVISTDPSSKLWPFDFARQSPYVDIFTAQMQPMENARNIALGGCESKLYVDLTGKQFWPTPHFNRTTLGYGLSPDEVSLFCSVLAISGVTGLHLYTKQHYFKPPYLDMFEFFFGAPHRKKGVLAASEFLNNFQVKQPSETLLAVFYSNESNQARRDTYRTVHAYTFIGPVAGSWFRFFDETTIDFERDLLSKIKLMYVPYATYQSRHVVGKLKSYVENGGILFLGDPLAFSYDLNGTITSNLREELAGCVLGEKSKLPTKSLRTITFTDDIFIPRDLQGEKLPVQTPIWNIKPGNKTRILAKFDDGTPAICLNSFGEGQVVYSAFNFFPAFGQSGNKKDFVDYTIVNHSGWKQFFRLFHHKLGIQIDRKIWRFRLLLPRESISPHSGKFCLTNNYADFRNEKAFFENNKLVEGFYSYKKEPDLIPDKNLALLPFDIGKLTDKIKAIESRSRTNPSDYMVKWADARNAEIRFIFSSSIRFSGLRITFSGRCPSIVIYAKDENSEFQILNEISANNVGSNISEMWIATDSPQHTSDIKVHFNNDPLPAKLTISEIEIWGSNVQRND